MLQSGKVLPFLNYAHTKLGKEKRSCSMEMSLEQ